MLLFIRITFYLQNNLASANNIQQFLNLSVSPASSPMALMLENTQAWSYLILIKPTIRHGSVACSSNLFHFTCQIKFLSSLSPTWKVIHTFSVHLNDFTPPQNLPPPLFLRVPCYQLHYSPYIFLTCRALHTPTSTYGHLTPPFYLSPGGLVLYPADSVMQYRSYSNTSLPRNLD